MDATPWNTTGDGGAQHRDCAPPDAPAPHTAASVSPAYHSRFTDWYDAAGVRSLPRREAERDAGLLCFPRELAPITKHPDVNGLGLAVQREALMHHLFSYLTFTDRLEDEVVNRTARRIATGAVALPISPAMRLDAYKIYCDEAYHSLFSADLMAQLREQHGFVYDGGGGHPALAHFHRERAALDVATRGWFELFFTIVSETLISSSLLRIPRAPDVLPAVRCLVADHAADEWRHHAFFAQVCELAWPRLPRAVKQRIGPALPAFILQFLSPDRPALARFLFRHVTRTRALDILEDSYPASAVAPQARHAARATLRVFEQAGVFEDPATADAFDAAGLRGHFSGVNEPEFTCEPGVNLVR